MLSKILHVSMWRRVHLPVYVFGILITGKFLILWWGPEGKVVWLSFMCELFSTGAVGRDVHRRFTPRPAMHGVHQPGDVEFINTVGKRAITTGRQGGGAV